MREVVRGSRAEGADRANSFRATTSNSSDPQQEVNQQSSIDDANTLTNEDSQDPASAGYPSTTYPSGAPRKVAFRADSNDPAEPRQSIARGRRRSSSIFRINSDRDEAWAHRPEAEVYHDSRAATKREFRRRATTLHDYYKQNPDLLPQLPFTWHHGKKRWRLIMLISFMWIDACAVPIALYYGLWYAGGVEGWIIFAIVTTIWGGPTYLEFAIRTIKLMKKERFYRPLGTNSRWCFDYLTWVSSFSIFVVTAIFIVGAAPHEVWLRVLCMPMPALLYCLGGLVAFPSLYHIKGWPAPFRLSSTAKGEMVKPGVYYFVEDTVAVNANAGRPYREALLARYEASPRFRRMLHNQSLFWSIPAIIIATPLTIISVIDQVPATVAYGIAWAVPFIWATIWGLISLRWCKRDMVREREEWEKTKAPLPKEQGFGVDPESSSSLRAPEESAIAEEDERTKKPAPEQIV